MASQIKEIKLYSRFFEKKFIKFLDHFPDIILIISLDKGYCIEVNQTFLNITGYSREEVINCVITELLFGLKAENYQQIKTILKKQDSLQNLEIDFYLKSGEKRIGLLSVKPINWKRQACLLNIVHDITERKQIEDDLRRIAIQDPLTGLPNRVYFMQQLENLLEHKQNFNNHVSAVLFLDLDEFKAINDNFGHAVGDEILIEVSRRLEAITQWGDIVARFGGDEFIMLLNNLKDFHGASHVANQVIEAIKKPFLVNGQKFYCSVSIGISIISTDNKSAKELLLQADESMYQAKAFGKSRYHIFNITT